MDNDIELDGIQRNELTIDGAFTMVDNEWVRGSGLSVGANFLWIYLLSHKIGYELRDPQILSETGFGVKGLRAARAELVEKGWLILTRKKNRDGSLGSYVYHLQDPRDPSGTVAIGTVAQGTVPQGSDNKRLLPKNTNSKKTISKRSLTADDYKPSQEFLDKLSERFPGVNVSVELEKFRDHHEAKGSRFELWDRAFQRWVRQASEWSPEAKKIRAQLEAEQEWQRYKRELGEE